MKTKQSLLVKVMVLLLAAVASPAFAAASISGGTGGTALSADTAATGGTGAYTTLTALVLTENAVRDVSNTGTIILNAPAGFQFNPAAAVTMSVAKLAGNGSQNQLILSSATATVTSNTITITVTTIDTTSARSSITWTGIQVRPIAATSTTGNVTSSGTVTIVGITANSTGFTTLTEVPGKATHLNFLQQPTDAAAATAISPAITIQLIDQFGTVATNISATNVTMSISTNPGGGTLSGTATVTAAAGVATFSTLSINKVGTGYTLAASTTTLAATNSTPFNITLGAPAKLVITSVPQTLVAGNSSGLITVQLQDAGGNSVTTTTNLPINLTQSAASGSFRDAADASTITSITVPAGSGSTNYLYHDTLAGTSTITNAATGLTPATQLETVQASAFDHFALVVGGSQPVGAVFSASVRAQDAFNNTVTTDSSTAVTFSGTGGVLFDANANGVYGDNTGTLTSGVLTVSTKDNTAETVTITATVNGTNLNANVTLTNTPGDYQTRASGNWNGTTTWQKWSGTAWTNTTVAPSSANGLISITNGCIVTNSTGTVTVDQVVVQSNAQIVVNTGTILSVNNAGLAGADLEVFGTIVNIGTVSGAGTTAFEAGSDYRHAQNGGAVPTATWGTGSTCEFIAWGNSTTAPTGIGQAFANFTWNSPAQSAALSLGGTLLTVNGNFTMTSSGSGSVALGNTGAGNLTIGGNYSQSGGDLIGSISAARSVTVLGSYSLTGGTNDLSSSVTAGSPVTLVVAGDFSLTGGVLTETGSTTGSGVIFTNGAHNFTNSASIANTVNFTVLNNSTLFLGANAIAGGGAFNLNSGGTLGLGSPSGITASGATGNIQSTGARVLSSGGKYIYNGSVAQVTGSGLTNCASVTVSNAAGVSLSGNVTVSGAFTVAGGGLLTGANTINGQLVINGTVAPGVGLGTLTTGRELWNSGGIYNWDISDATGLPGSGWDVLNLTSGNGIDLESTSGSPFTIKMVTGGSIANFLNGVTNTWIIASMANGTVTNFSADKITLDTSSFTNDLAGGSFSVVLLNSTNLAVRFTPLLAAQVAFVQQPTDATAGVAFSPAITVQVLDAATNPIAIAGIPVTLTVSSGSGPLNGVVTVPSDGTGLATFNGLSINSAGVKVLTASSAGLVSAVSTNFTITAAAASQLAIQTQPSTNAIAGAPFAQQPVVDILDAFGNLITTDNSTVITAARGAGSGTLQGTTGQPAVGGVVTFTDLFHTVATNITITFSSGSLTGATSTVIVVSPALATQLAFTTQPGGATVAVPFLTQPVVRTEDIFGNLSTVGLTTNLDLSLQLASGTGPLLGTTDFDIGTLAGNGTVTFTNLQLNVTGTNYQLTAQAAGFTNGLSAVFTVGVQNQTITFGPLADKTYGDPVFSVSATASSGLPVTFSLVSNSPATLINGTNIVFTGVGVVTVRASQPGDTNWTAAPDVDRFFTVNPKPVTSVVLVDNKVYDGGTSATITNYSLIGVVGLEDVSVGGGTATFADKTVATGKTVTVTGLSLGGINHDRYVLTSTNTTAVASITARTLTVTATGVDKEYDGTTNATVTLGDDRVAGDSLTNSYGAATFANASVGTNKLVTVTGLAVTGPDTSNYTLASTVTTTTANITIKTVTGSVGVTGKIYDGGVSATITNRTLSGTISGDDVSLSGGTATFADKNVAGSKTVITTGLNLAGTKAGNYTLASTSATNLADITVRTLNVSATGVNKQYDGTTNAIVTLGDDRVSGDDLTNSYAAAAFADANVGTNKLVTVTGIAVTGTDVGNYTLVSTTTTTTASITAVALTGSVGVAGKVYDGGTGATITNHSLSGVIGSDDVSLTGGTANFSDKNVGAAKTVITTNLSLAGAMAGNYALVSTSTTNTADITARTLNVSATGVNKQYDGTTNATVTLSDDRVAGDSLTNTYVAAAFADASIGTNKPVSVTGIAVTGGDVNNYTLASTAAGTTANITIRTVTGSVTISDKVYDATTNATIAIYSLSNSVSGDDVHLSGGTAAFVTASIGSNKTVNVTGLGLTGAAAGNYTLASSSATATANISIRTVTAVIAAANKTYDGGTSATITNRALVNAVAGDDVSLTGGVANFADKNIGVAKTVTATNLSLTGTKASNYTLTSTTATNSADISARTLTVTATGVNKQYDGTTNATVTLGDDRVVGDSLTNSYAAASFADANIGTNKLVTVTGLAVTGPDAGNYTLAATSTTTTANITGRPVVGSVTISNKVYDATTGATIVTYSLSNTVAGDDVSLTGGTASFASKTVGTAKAVTITGLSLTGTKAGNYLLASSSATNTADITSRTLTVSATGVSKQYDGTTNTTVILSDDRVSGDNLTNSYATASFANANVGTNKVVTVTGISVTGPDAGNYTLASATTTTTANITARPVTGSVTANNKVYDATTNATIATYSLSNAVAGDNVSLSGGTAAFVTVSIGSNKTVNVTGLVLAGTAAGNYTLASSAATTTASITIRSVTGSVTVNNKVYDATTNAIIAIYSLSNAVAGDNVSLSGGTAAFVTAGIGSNKTVNVTGLVLSGASAGNYSLTSSSASALANITSAIITVTADDKQRAYGAANPGFTVNYGGFVAGEGLEVLNGLPGISTTATSVSTVAGGPYPIIVTNGTLTASNYSFTFVNGSLTITQAVLQVKADDQSRLFGTPNPALTATIIGFANGETTNVLAGAPLLSTTATNNSAPGNYAITAAQGTLSSANYSFTFANGTLTVTKTILTVSANSANRVYGAANPVFTATYSGFVNGQTLGTSDVAGTPSLTAATTTNSAAGTYVITAAIGSLTSSNYSFVFSNAFLSVTKAGLTATPDNKTRAYGAVNPTLTATITGFVNGQTLGSSGVTGAAALSTTATNTSTVAGGPYLITATNGTLAAANYSFNFASGFLTVTQAISTNAVTSSLNPVRPGSNVTFTATLTAVAPGGGTPSGAVQFVIDGVNFGAPVLVSGGVATVNTASLSHANHTVQARYAGDGNFTGSTNNLLPDELVNSLPVAINDTLTTGVNIAASVAAATLTANDNDPDGDAFSLTSVSPFSLHGGTVVLLSGTVTYTPATNYAGLDSFTYTITDSFGAPANGTVNVTVQATTNSITQIVRLPDHNFRLTISGIPGQSYVTLAATNLNPTIVWTPISTNVCGSNSSFTVDDFTATNHPGRYYRSVLP